MDSKIYLTPKIRYEDTSPVVGVLGGNSKLPIWNPAIKLTPGILDFKVYDEYLSPNLQDYGRMTHQQIKSWCRDRNIPINSNNANGDNVNGNNIDNLHRIFNWLQNKGYLTSDQIEINKSLLLWDETYWNGDLLTIRDQLPTKEYETIHPLYNNSRLDDIDSFEFRWWYLSIILDLPSFTTQLNINDIGEMNPHKTLSLESQIINTLIKEKLPNITDDFTIPQLHILYNTQSIIQVIGQTPHKLQNYIVQSSSLSTRDSLDILPAPIKSFIIDYKNEGWDEINYYHMNILAYSFVVTQENVQRPSLHLDNKHKIIDTLPYIGDKAIFEWLNIYVLYTDRWNLERQIALLFESPQYFVAPWTGGNKKLYIGTYWQRELADVTKVPPHIIRQYKSLGMI